MLEKEKKKSFTLAEVLITLGIIGVVAGMTIPTLYNNYLKNSTVTKLQKFYTITYQAIKLSEIDNGTTNTWDYGTSNNGSSTLNWFNTYLAPYTKYTNITQASSNITVDFIDGSSATYQKGTNMDISYLVNGSGTSKTNGKDIFYFEIDPTSTTNAFRPYDFSAMGTGRSKWTSLSYACKTAGTKHYCAGLIMYDNWQIKSDYPYFN